MTTAQFEKFESSMLADVESWYESQRAKPKAVPKKKGPVQTSIATGRVETGRVNTNVMATGLMVGGYMGGGLPITPQRYRSRGGSQLLNISGSFIETVLAQHDELRRFTSEGGRTSRGTLVLGEALVTIMNDSARVAMYAQMSVAERDSAAASLKGWFVERLQVDFFNRQRITAQIDASKPVQVAVHALIDAARRKDQSSAGAFVHHLVGAYLDRQFPQSGVNSETYTTADLQTQRSGDYQIGGTAVHVTMRPTEALFDRRCRDNIAKKLRPLVLVPDSAVSAATQLAEIQNMQDHVSVQSIETFIGTGVEEAGLYESKTIRTQLRGLLEAYNERVGRIEPDPSLLIAIPGRF
ncbi:DUF4928 family protein [Cryobacterium sp. HLT2-28]|uniref:DUF4928 family protein n=1 Tax=Cryobacterium sp. HLT2-28 TaxID=1259146 RepID=UPI00106AAA47|nr:DUF4928 family protein [Cryobacterium sp. HLT2-28]TFB91458.1 DUF4928 domain-containing protein [Cryobacterium sp. HLT2-28]